MPEETKPVEREGFTEFKLRLVDELHERLGRCGHCGKTCCPERKAWSKLPDQIPLATLIEAVLALKGSR